MNIIFYNYSKLIIIVYLLKILPIQNGLNVSCSPEAAAGITHTEITMNVRANKYCLRKIILIKYKKIIYSNVLFVIQNMWNKSL